MRARFEFTDMPLIGQPMEDHGVILKRQPVPNVVYTNVPHLAVQHSPSGFEFGYMGSGPADLALNICQAAAIALGYQGPTSKTYGDHLVFTAVVSMYQAFKFDYLGTVPRAGGHIPWAVVTEFVAQQLKEWDSAHPQELADQRNDHDDDITEGD